MKQILFFVITMVCIKSTFAIVPESCQNFSEIEKERLCQAFYYYSRKETASDIIQDENTSKMVDALNLGEDGDCSSIIENSIYRSLCEANRLFFDMSAISPFGTPIFLNKNDVTKGLFTAISLLNYGKPLPNLKHCPMSPLIFKELSKEKNQSLYEAVWTGILSAGYDQQKSDHSSKSKKFSDIAREFGYKYLIHGSMAIYDILKNGKINTLESDLSRPPFIFMELIKNIPQKSEELYGNSVVLPLEVLDQNMPFHASYGWAECGGIKIGSSISNRNTISEFRDFIKNMRDDKGNEFVFRSPIDMRKNFPIKILLTKNQLSEKVAWNVWTRFDEAFQNELSEYSNIVKELAE